MRVSVKADEWWWGGVVANSQEMPFGRVAHRRTSLNRRISDQRSGRDRTRGRSWVDAVLAEDHQL